MSADPRTSEEWQLAVDAAQGCLALEFIRVLGFIEEAGTVDVSRCCEILDRAERSGIVPSVDAIQHFIAETTSEIETERVYRVFLKAHEMSGHPDLASIVPFLTEERFA